jgi:hypothetical protein
MGKGEAVRHAQHVKKKISTPVLLGICILRIFDTFAKDREMTLYPLIYGVLNASTSPSQIPQ